MSVVLNGVTYDASQFVGYGYLQTMAHNGLQLFPNSIFTDMLAQLASATSVQGVSPGTGGNLLISNGSAWTTTSVASTTKALLVGGAILGSDPGGTDLLRVGGAATVNGLVTVKTAGQGIQILTSGNVGASGSVYQRWNDANGNAALIGYIGTASQFEVTNLLNGPTVFKTNNAIALTLTAAQAAVLGTDPGGSNLLRVGGTAFITGKLSLGTTVQTNAQLNVTYDGNTTNGITYFDTDTTATHSNVFVVFNRNASAIGNVRYIASTAKLSFNALNNLVFGTGVSETVGLLIDATQHAIVGTDPGGSDLLRVGGGITAATGSFATSVNTFALLSARNTNAGSAAGQALYLGNDASAFVGTLEVSSSTYTPASYYVANGMFLFANQAGGLTIGSASGSATTRIWSGGALALTFDTSQRIKYNGPRGTGSGAALLGANSPSTHLSAPYDWVDVVASDGTLCTMPIWQK